MLEAVFTALKAMRPPFMLHEYDIHQMIGICLADAGFDFIHEAKIGAGCRIDYLVGRVGIEIKKGKPVVATLCRQLARYAACDGVESLIVITQRSVRIPESVLGKPIRHLVLSQLWGVALP